METPFLLLKVFNSEHFFPTGASSAKSKMLTRMHSSRLRTVRCSGRLWGGVSAREGCLGGCLPRGVVLYTYPPVDRMTDACENITFPQLLLRTVIKYLTLR